MRERALDINKLDRTDKTAGVAVLTICESLPVALNDLKFIDDKETRAVLADAAAAHRNAIPVSPPPNGHRAVAAVIERIIDRGNWVQKPLSASRGQTA